MMQTLQTTGLLLLLGLGAHLSHRAVVDAAPEAQVTIREALPSITALKGLSLSYPSFVADYYWLKTIGQFGDNAMHAANYPNIAALTERIVALDPYFIGAYRFAGTAFTIKQIDATDEAAALLKQGALFRPDDWSIPFLLGFNSYFELQDYDTGAKALAQAALLPGAPDVAGPLATRLAAEAREPEVGLTLVDTLLATVADEKIRETYLERRKLLVLELDLKWLNRFAQEYQRANGRPVSGLRELLDAGLIKEMPVEPLGGSYYVDGNGVVQTTSEKQRLRLKK